MTLNLRGGVLAVVMRLALVPLNPTVGDVAGNVEKMAFWIDSAVGKNCHAIIFPEMSLLGYPPRDLLHYAVLHERQAKAIQDLKRRSKKIAIVTGGVEKNLSPGAPFFNAAFVLHNGQRLTYAKRLLPHYDVFDERRYFEPGGKPLVFKMGRHRIGLTVCEDAWGKDADVGKFYAQDPLRDYLPLKPTLMVNISASPFEIGKPRRRHLALKSVSSRLGISVVQVNQLGGNDDLVFDGGATVYDGRGKAVFEAPRFTEDLFVFDTDAPAPDKVPPTPDGENDWEDVRRALALGVRDYVRKCGFSKVILGLSGGIDSALTAQIAAEALGPENVQGVLLPSRYTSDASILDATRLAKNLGVETLFIDIGGLHKDYEGAFKKIFGKRGAKDLTAQNVQARIRGNLLMAIANDSGRLLLNTTNKSEMTVGYGTLYGDMCGALAVISDLTKESVYALSRHMNPRFEVIPEAVFTKAPTAELKAGQKDSDTLPPYEELDPIVRDWVEGERFSTRDLAKHPDLARSFLASEYKRRQAPIGLRVTGKAFGSGRRFPVAMRLPA